ncbi:hypothetical protein THAOC_07929 [Thalassiosira oceanica]|uniref:Uncharacterized protein n=1 Tax=Thalassiosira oceanica TaxID=159749 RepID=K0TBB8_THAOC|nr:hypothetical protein THAOC_07929 [Thalassiosira oceanica]|eukprot:EJK70691.1 hypothetical protein THAOC_07929 [Thalassiosira oceanica]
MHLTSFHIPRDSGKTTWEPTSTSTSTATPCFRADISGFEPPGTPQIQQVYSAMDPLLAYTLAPMHLSAFSIPRDSGKTTWEPTSTSTSTATPCFRADISGFEPPGTPQIQQAYTRKVAFGARQDNDSRSGTAACIGRASVVSGARVPQGTSKPLVTTSLVSEREEAVPSQIEFSTVDLSPEKDLQHRLEVLTLATDGERKGFQWRVGEYTNVTELGDLWLRLRLRMGLAPLFLPSGFRGGFQLQLKRTSARYDRARRPLDRVSEGVLGGSLQATHCGSAQPAVGSTPTRAMDQRRLRAQLYTLISHVRQPLAPPP